MTASLKKTGGPRALTLINSPQLSAGAAVSFCCSSRVCVTVVLRHLRGVKTHFKRFPTAFSTDGTDPLEAHYSRVQVIDNKPGNAIVNDLLHSGGCPALIRVNSTGIATNYNQPAAGRTAR